MLAQDGAQERVDPDAPACPPPCPAPSVSSSSIVPLPLSSHPLPHLLPLFLFPFSCFLSGPSLCLSLPLGFLWMKEEERAGAGPGGQRGHRRPAVPAFQGLKDAGLGPSLWPVWLWTPPVREGGSGGSHSTRSLQGPCLHPDKPVQRPCRDALSRS